jgi:uncharacterized protein CbrC (UPF0167 family)
MANSHPQFRYRPYPVQNLAAAKDYACFREPERKRTFKYVRTGSAENAHKPTPQLEIMSRILEAEHMI